MFDIFNGNGTYKLLKWGDLLGGTGEKRFLFCFNQNILGALSEAIVYLCLLLMSSIGGGEYYSPPMGHGWEDRSTKTATHVLTNSIIRVNYDLGVVYDDADSKKLRQLNELTRGWPHFLFVVDRRKGEKPSMLCGRATRSMSFISSIFHLSSILIATFCPV